MGREKYLAQKKGGLAYLHEGWQILDEGNSLLDMRQTLQHHPLIELLPYQRQNILYRGHRLRKAPACCASARLIVQHLPWNIQVRVGSELQRELTPYSISP